MTTHGPRSDVLPEWANPPWPEESPLGPRQLLSLLADLNTRFGGRFNATVNAFHLDIACLEEESPGASYRSTP